MNISSSPVVRTVFSISSYLIMWRRSSPGRHCAWVSSQTCVGYQANRPQTHYTSGWRVQMDNDRRPVLHGNHLSVMLYTSPAALRAIPVWTILGVLYYSPEPGGALGRASGASAMTIFGIQYRHHYRCEQVCAPRHCRRRYWAKAVDGQHGRAKGRGDMVCVDCRGKRQYWTVGVSRSPRADLNNRAS